MLNTAGLGWMITHRVLIMASFGDEASSLCSLSQCLTWVCVVGSWWRPPTTPNRTMATRYLTSTRPSGPGPHRQTADILHIVQADRTMNSSRITSVFCCWLCAQVYWENGAQIVSPHDKGISKAIEDHLEPWPESWNTEKALKSPLLKDPYQDVQTQYFEAIQKHCHHRWEQVSHTSGCSARIAASSPTFPPFPSSET